MSWVLICTVHLTVCSYYVMYAFRRGSTLYSYLNVKELFAQIRRDVWSLRKCNKNWAEKLSIYLKEIIFYIKLHVINSLNILGVFFLGIYNPGHNILVLFDNLAQVRIVTSKTKLDIYYNKLGTWVASRVTEQLKT